MDAETLRLFLLPLHAGLGVLGVGVVALVAAAIVAFSAAQLTQYFPSGPE